MGVWGLNSEKQKSELRRMPCSILVWCPFPVRRADAQNCTYNLTDWNFVVDTEVGGSGKVFVITELRGGLHGAQHECWERHCNSQQEL